MENNMISLRDSIKVLGDYKLKTRPVITSYCRDGLVPSKFINGKWFVEKDYIEKALAWRETSVTLDDLLDILLSRERLSEEEWNNDKRNFAYRLQDYKFLENEYSILFPEKFVSSESVGHLEDMIVSEIEKIKKQKILISVRDASVKMGLSSYQVKQLIRNGYIEAELVNNNWCLSEKVIDKYIEKKNEYVGVYDIASEVVQNKNTLWDCDDRIDRAMLNNYLRNSEISYLLVESETINLKGDRKNSLYISLLHKEVAVEVISRYVSTYGLQSELLETLKQSEYFLSHPVNRRLLDEFEPQKTIPGMVALYDTIINSCNTEILCCTDSDVKNMMKYCSAQKKKIYKKYLSSFLRFVQENYHCEYAITIKSEKSNGLINSLPYKMEQFYAFAYMIFNESYISEKKLIDKAISKPKFSFLWLYCAWHYVAAWRKKDICNIPVIPLLSSYDDVVNKIQLGIYDDEAVKVAGLLEYYINERFTPPSKTENRQKERFLVVSIRSGLRKIIGTIYSIFCFHYHDQLVPNGGFSFNEYVEFFGDQYINIFGKKPFSNRRANKAFLGEIATITEIEQGVDNKVLGYRVASYARAHVENDAYISGVTSKYLLTKLDGLTKDEIIFELFETGFCSFVPYYLLEIIYGEDFAKLPVNEQSEVIKQWGVSANRTEEMVVYLEDCFSKADLTINQFFRNCGVEKKKELAEEMLDNILGRKAIGKETGVSCLPAARRLPCINRGREHCLGCKYAIYERTYFWKALNVVNATYNKLKNAKTDGERKKIRMMLDNDYLPSITEMIEIAKNKYGIEVDDYQKLLIDIIKKKGIEKDE